MIISFYARYRRAVNGRCLFFEQARCRVWQKHENGHSKAQQESGEENRGKVAETSLQQVDLLHFALRRRHLSL
jgi:hypothetical protein